MYSKKKKEEDKTNRKMTDFFLTNPKPDSSKVGQQVEEIAGSSSEKEATEKEKDSGHAEREGQGQRYKSPTLNLHYINHGEGR